MSEFLLYFSQCFFFLCAFLLGYLLMGRYLDWIFGDDDYEL